MHLAPTEGFDGDIEVIGTGTGDFQHAGRGESWAAVAVVLNLDVGILLLDFAYQLGQQVRPADARHILEADLVGSVLHHMVHDVHVVGDGVHGGEGDGEGSLRDHLPLLGVFHRELEVAVVVEAAERTGDVHALGLLYLVHEFAHVCRNGVHAKGVERTLEHVGLDAGLVEGGRPRPDGAVRVLAVEKVNLFESAAVGLDAVEASHIYDSGSHPDQLVHPGLVFSGRLPHVPVNEGEFDFACHYIRIFTKINNFRLAR